MTSLALNPKDIRGILWCTIALLLGQMTFGVVAARRAELTANRFEERLSTMERSFGTQLDAISAFIRYTTDGVWIELPRDGSPTLGADDASVQVIEFADFLCPACAAISDSLLALVRSSNRIQLVFKHYPLTSIRSESFGAALGGQCAATQGRFWEYQTLAYKRQEDINRLGVSAVIALAETLRLDSSHFDQCVRSANARRRVEQDRELGYRLTIFDTPTFFVNGKRLQSGNWDFLRSAIEWELRSVRRKSLGVSSERGPFERKKGGIGGQPGH